MWVELMIFLSFVLLVAGPIFGYPILIVVSAVMAIFTLALWRVTVPTASKLFDTKISGKMLLDIRDERKKMNLLPTKFESGYAVIDKYTKIPVDYDAVYSLDGIPVQTIWRSIGKGLRIFQSSFHRA